MKKILFAALFLSCAANVARAQPPVAMVAKVSAIEHQVEKRAGIGPAWTETKAGEILRAGDGFRTGKRSKADINFADGSLVRLGQLSSVEFTGEKQVKLRAGALLFSFLKPGRVLTGDFA